MKIEATITLAPWATKELLSSELGRLSCVESATLSEAGAAEVDTRLAGRRFNREISEAWLKEVDACQRGVRFWRRSGSPADPAAMYAIAAKANQPAFLDFLVNYCTEEVEE